MHGIQGLGASALAFRVHEDDPDFFGQLIWVSARHADGEPMPIGEMVRFILRRLGVAAADQESSLPDLLEEYQRVARTQRFMVVLDDVTDTQPVELLVPSNAPEVVVLVTTRVRMQSLLRSDFEEIRLERLLAAESEELFRDKLGGTADKIDTAVVAELASFGGGIPLVLVLMAGHVVGRPHVADRLVTDLRSSLSYLFRLDEEQRMPKWLDLAVARLSPELSARYPILSLIPGSDFSIETAAVALGVDVDEAGRMLDDLVEINLLVRNSDAPQRLRYAFYSIVRADAEARVKRGTGIDTAEVVLRVCTAFLEQTALNDLALSGRWRVGPVFVWLRNLVTEIGVSVGREEALAWFEREWLNVAACVRAAKLAGLHEEATQLCVALFKYVHLNKLVDVWINVHNDGLDSARTLSDQLAIMQLSNQRGAGHLEVGNYQAARRDFEESLQAARAAQLQLGPRDPLFPMAVIGEQSALEWLGKVTAAERDPVALDYYDQSWAVLERPDDQVDPDQKKRAFATLRLQRARFFVVFEDWSRAVSEIEPAFAYFDGTAELDNQAKCLVTWGQAHIGGGQAAKALVRFERAADLLGRNSAGREYALVMEMVGDAALAAEDIHRATDAFRTSLDILDKIGSPQADRIRTKLAPLLNADHND
ncbi:NB-ARC domain-containing protein [Kibdelosporangium philippinense]|uniref:NB-ARC domain-containing protein n=1 Tax=Kibdelosporangium philippinense TaxID=211113 RepID=UPI00361C6912